MKHFEITGKLTNGYGRTVSITVYNKKSGDVFYVGLEQVEDLIDLVQRHLTPIAPDTEGCIHCDSGEEIPAAFTYCPYCSRTLPHQRAKSLYVKG